MLRVQGSGEFTPTAAHVWIWRGCFTACRTLGPGDLCLGPCSPYMNKYLLSTTLTRCLISDTLTRKRTRNGAAEASEESPERRPEADHPVLVAPECSCRPDSSLSDVCDPVTGQCPCRAHFHGLSCQLCSKGYWQPALSGQCQPCNCDPTRSYGDTCDQVGPLLSVCTSEPCIFFQFYTIA